MSFFAKRMHCPQRTCLLLLSAASMVGSQSSGPFDELRRLTVTTQGKYSAADAQSIGIELARALGLDPLTTQALGQLLANEQLAWQHGAKSDIDENRLTLALNTHFDLSAAPEYLQFRVQELRKIRVFLGTKVPRLSRSAGPNSQTTGEQILGPGMSPFEAFLAASLLVYQKISNPDYLRAAVEQQAQRPQQNDAELKNPRLAIRTPDAREAEFRSKLDAVTKREWSTTESVLHTVETILKESRNR